MTDRLARLDPRARRTRALLRDALMVLIIERGEYDSINIKEITERAEVSRSTFYLHFTDVDHLLFDTMRDLYAEIIAVFEQHDGPKPGDAHEFRHVAEYADFYRVMFSERGSQAFTHRLHNFFAEQVQHFLAKRLPEDHETTLPLPMIAHFMAGALIGVMQWWLENDMPHNAEEIAYMADQFMLNGLAWGLGVSEMSQVMRWLDVLTISIETETDEA